MQPDATIVRVHEGGARHREAVAQVLGEAKSARAVEARAAAKLAAVLREADKGAREAMHAEGWLVRAAAPFEAPAAAARVPPVLQLGTGANAGSLGAAKPRPAVLATSTTIAASETYAPALSAVAAPRDVDEATGLGAWVAISDEEVFLRETAREAHVAAAAVADAAVAGHKRRLGELGVGGVASSSAHAAGDADGGDDAYIAFNPYGGKYRGIDLEGGSGGSGGGDGNGASGPALEAAAPPASVRAPVTLSLRGTSGRAAASSNMTTVACAEGSGTSNGDDRNEAVVNAAVNAAVNTSAPTLAATSTDAPAPPPTVDAAPVDAGLFKARLLKTSTQLRKRSAFDDDN